MIRTMMTKNVNKKGSVKITKKTRNPWKVINGVTIKVTGKNSDKRFGANVSIPTSEVAVAAATTAAARATIKTITTKTKKIEYVKAACHRC